MHVLLASASINYQKDIQMNKFRTLLIASLILSIGVGSAFASENGNNYEKKENKEYKNAGSESRPNGQNGKYMAGDDVISPQSQASNDKESKPAFKAGTTLENLQAAFNGESNAAAKYAAYAKKADEEGYGDVASLFRAASRAEQIHSENHATVIRGLGAEPVANVVLPEIHTTMENLKSAVAGESFERDTMYPAYMQVARRDRNRDALRTFNYAQAAETKHAQYYTEAGEALIEFKDSKGVLWYVCPTCGETLPASEWAKLSKCPVCFTQTSTFEAIS